MRKITMAILLLRAVAGMAQGYITYENLSSSTLRNELGERFGSGDMYMVSAGYTIPLSSKENEWGQRTAWMTSISATYAEMGNHGEAREMNPSSIINSGISLTHIRPISEKWSIIANAGCGIYAPANEISAKSILGSGGVIFVCRLNNNLSLGIGGGITNSYGAPMAMPMLYLNWQRNGKFTFRIDMANSIKMAVSTHFSDRFSLEFVPLEMDGLAAVMSVEGQEQVYSMMMLRSYLSPSFRFGKRMTLFATVGGNWIRGIKTTERSLKGFFDGFTDDGKDDPYFQPALRLSAGMRFSL
ncbi:hypothetical protein HPS57_07355 [Prevotella sp. PINT]|jgi:hypothetical protein|uniref:DUF6268 family outer membrane beta-barrel protein n=1 Tax=Palleniella intestinalis TaxID=2736291 RepID=UPI0015532474|nr:DUF6268 family outer membrane beta-barrel protein [Palleniella intestinalis]NPD81789.1 hypothetical protein [Palleniella intestinalis]